MQKTIGDKRFASRATIDKLFVTLETDSCFLLRCFGQDKEGIFLIIFEISNIFNYNYIINLSSSLI